MYASRQLWHRHWRVILIIAALVNVFVWGIALLRPEKLTDDVWSIELAGDCHLDYHAPIHAVTLACPGVDYMRLWPLPVKQPW